MKIVTVPNPILIKKSKSITSFDSRLKNFCQNLVKTLLNAKNPSGIGLAAPQVGKNRRIFTIALPDKKPQIFINPKITHHSQEKKYFHLKSDGHQEPFLEGCLSIPKTYGAVKRWPKIKAIWQNEKGEKQQAVFDNLKAIVFQHEHDHLNGILFTQRMIEQEEQSHPTVFFGSEENSVIVLKKLISLPSLRIVAVVTQPPRPKGRKKILTPTPVAQFAQKHHLAILTPEKLDQKVINYLKKDKKPKLGVLAAYGKIIPQKLIDIFPWGIINIHPSLLPKFRGPTPVEAALLSNQKESGVSIFIIDFQIDHGPLLTQTKEKIRRHDNQESLSRRLFKLGAETLADILPQYLSKQTIPTSQNHRKATFTKLLNRDDGYIEYGALKKAINKGEAKAIEIERKIRAYHPWPGTFTVLENQKRMKIIKAHLENKKLVLEEIQLEGKKPVTCDKNSQKLVFE